MYAIRTTNLRKCYKKITAVDGINLEIKEGELFSLLGVNGAGKTTVIRMLSCLTTPTEGEILVGGFDALKDPDKVKRIIGVSPQETAVAPNLTVRENLDLMCGIYGFSGEKSKKTIERLESLLSLKDVMKRKAGKLSGGWQRRLSIALSLIGEPKILFLDEPTLGLDVIARQDLWSVIRSMRGEVTIIMTTHYMEEAEALSDRIGIMKDGRLLTVGTAEELINKTGAKSFESAFISIVKEDSI